MCAAFNPFTTTLLLGNTVVSRLCEPIIAGKITHSIRLISIRCAATGSSRLGFGAPAGIEGVRNIGADTSLVIRTTEVLSGGALGLLLDELVGDAGGVIRRRLESCGANTTSSIRGRHEPSGWANTTFRVRRWYKPGGANTCGWCSLRYDERCRASGATFNRIKRSTLEASDFRSSRGGRLLAPFITGGRATNTSLAHNRSQIEITIGSRRAFAA